jgi:uncharacterized protein YqeY
MEMTTKTELENALKDAMRAGDEVRKRTLRMALSTIRLEEVEKGAALDENGVNSLLLKELKARNESIADAQRANRPDLVAEAQAEIGVLQELLPRQLSAAELEDLARQVIAEVGATGPQDVGKVMKALMPRLQGRASGDQASQTVRRLLA